MKWLSVWMVLGVAVAPADELKHLSGAGQDEDLDRASFTSTAAWGKEFKEWTRKRTRFLPKDWKTSFQLAEPPRNTSIRTKAELEYLRGVVNERAKAQSAIESEILITNFRFGKHRYEELITLPKFKETGKLLKAAYLDIAVAIFVFKERFDRIRPSVLATKLDLALDPTIEIPPHPAYPSGHATGAYGLAYLLQEVDPANADGYLKDAGRIGRNREVAGVHYPSDTEAGRLLARQIVDALLSNPAFVRQLEAARAEW